MLTNHQRGLVVLMAHKECSRYISLIVIWKLLKLHLLGINELKFSQLKTRRLLTRFLLNLKTLGLIHYIRQCHPLQWRHNEWFGVSNHQPLHCLLNHSFCRRSKKTSKLRVTGLCAGNSPVTGEFPAQKASNAENVSIWWRHHGKAFSWHLIFAAANNIPDFLV